MKGRHILLLAAMAAELILFLYCLIRKTKIISFHPIDSGQLMEAEDSAFWEKVISLSRTGYRIQ